MTNEEKVKNIKRTFRLFMNGVASHSMREKGMSYKVNWGISIPALRSIAADYEPSRELALLLWESDVRECKILATMLMPPALCDEATAERLVSECPNQEIAEVLAHNVLQKIPGTMTLAGRLLADNRPLARLCALHLCSRLMSGGAVLSREMTETLAGMVVAAAKEGNTGMLHAAINCVTKYSDTPQQYTSLLQQSLKNNGLDIF